MNDTHQVLIYADEAMISHNRKKYRFLLNAFKVLSLQVTTKYMEVGRHRPMMGNNHITAVSFLANQNSIHEKMKCGLHAGNSLYYLAQTLVSSRILSRSLKMKCIN
jgi:hypothetical protein